MQLQRDQNFYRGTFAAMANPCDVLVESDDETLARDILNAAAEEALRIERKFSRYRDDSVVHAINSSQGKPFRVDTETANLIDYAATLWRLSEGAFDITSGVLRHAWRFNEPELRPTQEQISNLLSHVGWQRVTWNAGELSMPAGMELDFGGIGKEYAVDCAVKLIEELANIAVLVNFGGDLRTAGPTPRDSAWQVGIESALVKGSAVKLVKLVSGAMATSGDTRRYLEIDGVRYGHILDARTGWPAPQAPRSVTVAADTCSQAGTYTTLAMLQGSDAEEFLESEGVRYWCLR